MNRSSNECFWEKCAKENICTQEQDVINESKKE
jgi:hypothetical protein